jgi:glycosyltransferase 2 family protein
MQAHAENQHTGNSVAPGRTRLTQRRWWPLFKRITGLLFFALIAWLLYTQARNIDWDKVLNALEHYPVTAAWGAAALAATSLLLYSCFDLLGRHYTSHTLGTPAVMLTTFVCYVFNLNLGSVVGSIALRYRLYSRLGLATGTITRIMTLSMLSNWLGYILLAGLVVSIRPPQLPPDWGIDPGELRLIGAVLLALAAAYLAACAFSRRRSFMVAGHEIELPSVRLAALQMMMGACNWLLMSCVVFILLQHKVGFPEVVSTLLLGAVAALITHIPAGLGVLEAVFIALLSYRMPQHDLLAGLVAYRVVYYLVPLAIASVLYLAMESRAKHLARRSRLRYQAEQADSGQNAQKPPKKPAEALRPTGP